MYVSPAIAVYLSVSPPTSIWWVVTNRRGSETSTLGTEGRSSSLEIGTPKSEELSSGSLWAIAVPACITNARTTIIHTLFIFRYVTPNPRFFRRIHDSSKQNRRCSGIKYSKITPGSHSAHKLRLRNLVAFPRTPRRKYGCEF